MGGQNEIMKMLQAFYYDGELFCDFGRIKRKISCKCINLDDIDAITTVVLMVYGAVSG